MTFHVFTSTNHEIFFDQPHLAAKNLPQLLLLIFIN